MISSEILDKYCPSLSELDLIYNSENEDMEFPWLSGIRERLRSEFGSRVLTVGHRALRGDMHCFTLYCYSKGDSDNIPHIGRSGFMRSPAVEEMIRTHCHAGAKIMCLIKEPDFLTLYRNRLTEIISKEQRKTIESFFSGIPLVYLHIGNPVICVTETKEDAAKLIISDELGTIKRRIYTLLKIYDKYNALLEEDAAIFTDHKEHMDKMPLYGKWVEDMTKNESSIYENKLAAYGFERKCREKAARMVAEMTQDEKLGLLSTHHNATERLGMGEFWIGTEVARGFVGREPDRYSTVFPQPVGLAATFDRELMRELGIIAGTEARAYYNREKKGGIMLWGPTVDMERDPRWGRTEEAYGEDVCLAGELTSAYTLGMAGLSDDGYYMTVPTLKHFCADNNEDIRVNCDAYIPLRLKYEYYYAAFEYPIRKGGARSIMTAYNEINGLPAIMNPELETMLKNEWGLWFVVSDGGDFTQNVTEHHYCTDMSEGYALSLKAGCDTMTDHEKPVRAAAEKALERGLITWEDIDRSIINTVTARLLTGNIGGCEYDNIGDEVIDCPAHRETNLRAAREQLVLLKNEGILPVKETPAKIAAVGAMADEMLRDWYTGYYRDGVSILQGIRNEFPETEIVHDSLWDRIAIKAPNDKYLSAHEDGTVKADADEIGESEIFEIQDWGENWTNLFSVRYQKYTRLSDGDLRLHNRSIYDWFTRETFNIRETKGGVLIEEYQFHKRMSVDVDGNVKFIAKRAVTPEQVFITETVSTGTERAAQLASDCGLVIYCTGNYPVQTAKECYDRKTLALNVQPGMAVKLWEANNNTVMVLVSSYPYAINDENSLLPAIIYTTHAGAHLGTAVAETLSGRNNPSGHLPLTWYRSENELPDILDYDIETSGSTYMYFEGKPLYPFGYGLSYSEFEYGKPSVTVTDDHILLKADITNISETDGTAVIQVYFTMPDSAAKRASKKLCGFERVYIKSGETVTAEVTIDSDILRIYDVRSGRMIVENGKYLFSVGASSSDIRGLAEAVIETGESIGKRPSHFGAASFEECDNIRIHNSRAYAADTVRPKMWNGTVTYRGIDFTAGQTVTAMISAILGNDTVTFTAGGQTIETKTVVSDFYDDFKKVTVYFDNTAELRSSDELRIKLAEGMTLLDVEITP